MDDNRRINLKEEAKAFDSQILERVKNGHVPDLRRSGRCEYFYNNVWRDQEFANLYFGEIVEKVKFACKEYINDKKIINILEVGCGPGHISLELARNGFSVVGLDISTICIKVANDTAKTDPWIKERGKLNYISEDFLEHKGKYDVILFAAALHHFPKCEEAIKHSYNLLNENSLIIIDEPIKEQVSKRNCAVIFLIKTLFSATKSYFKDIRLPFDENELQKQLEKIYHEERYELDDCTNIQSIHDNASSYKDMISALKKEFKVLENRKEYALFHQLIGGMRLKNIEKEHELAKFIKLMDFTLCKEGAIDPTNFFFVGKKD